MKKLSFDITPFSTVENLADEAVHVAIRYIQEVLGVDTGDVAGHFFGHGMEKLAASPFIGYAKAEIDCADEDLTHDVCVRCGACVLMASILDDGGCLECKPRELKRFDVETHAIKPGLMTPPIRDHEIREFIHMSVGTEIDPKVAAEWAKALDASPERFPVATGDEPATSAFVAMPPRHMMSSNVKLGPKFMDAGELRAALGYGDHEDE